LKLRASVNRSIRSPGISSLFSPQQIGLWSGEDKCANGDDGIPTASQAACAQTGLTAAQYGNTNASPASQYNQFSGGNPDLKPEVGDTISLGAVWDITDNIGASIDYWSIEMSDTIASVGAQRQLTECIENGRFCDNIQRSPSGSLWLGQEGYVVNLIDNIGGTKWEGVDVSTNATFDVTGGSIKASLVGSYALKREITPVSEVPDTTYSCEGLINTTCGVLPQWRHTVNVRYYNDNGWFVGANWRHFSAVDYVDTDGVAQTTDTLVAEDGGIKQQNYLDVVGGLDITENVRAQIGVNNVLDVESPIMGGTLGGNGNTIAGFYDTLGRLIFADLTVKF